MLLLALTARLATAAPAHSANPNVATDADDAADADADDNAGTNAAHSFDVDKLFDCFDADADDRHDDLDDVDDLDDLDDANERHGDADDHHDDLDDDDALDDADVACTTDAYEPDDATPGPTASPPLDAAELADNDDPIAFEDFVLDEDASEDAGSVIATEQREALRRRRRSRFGHVDVSLGWRRTMAVRDVIDARNEVWLTATWRL